MEPPFTVGDALQHDPKIAEAKKVIIETVKTYQQKITQVKPPHPALKQSYDELLTKFYQYRGGPLWFPYLGSGIGHGALVELLDGSVKYDFICGIGPHFFGHNYPALMEASLDAAISNTVMQGHLQQNRDSLEISEMLIKASGMDHCFLATAGAMANENALKIAFQKKYPAYRVLAFERCFMGRTLAMTQVTDKPSFRIGLPYTLSVDYVPFFDPNQPEASTKQALAILKKYLQRYPKQHAVMCFELIQGEGGFHSGTKEFYESIMSLLKEHEVLILDDEIQSFGRTTQLFAFQYFGLEKYIDIVSIGKLSQICATLFIDSVKPQPGLLSQTFTGSTSTIRASMAILKLLLQGDFYGPEGKIARVHHHFVGKLKKIAEQHPHLISGPYGVGSMIAFTPLDGNAQKVTKFVHDLYDNGVISFIAGSHPTRVRFLPPVGVLTFDDIDQVSTIIEKTLLQQEML